ncbi:hypothetical protein [Halorubrum sp. CSM-61]|uniref:hypothetical protein n=1 Tax=Halorubrum sp. CSM-61 TaxID=2485838 RepID=UPI000F4B0A56|nr:hypothetical protein [Halorubrum sp. CSM-61]
MSDDLNSHFDSDYLETVIVLQHQKYHQQQSLARGLLGSLLAIIAIITSVSVAFYDSIEPVPTETDAYISIANSLSIHPEGLLLFILLNQVLSFVLLSFCVTACLISLYKLYEVVLGRELYPQYEYPVAKRWIDLHQSAFKNQRLISDTRKKVTTGGLRISISILFLFVCYSIYTNTYGANILNLLSYNLLFIFPAPGRFLLNRIVDNDHTNEEVADSTLGQELVDNPDTSSRWGLLEWFLIEKVMALLSWVICFLCLVVLAVAFII